MKFLVPRPTLLIRHVASDTKNDKIALSIRTESEFLSGMITAYIRERNLHPFMIFTSYYLFI